MRYTNYTNLDASYDRPYQRGDRLVRGYSGEITHMDVLGDPPPELLRVAEFVFMRHNADSRPDGQLCPSMSVGDVVIIGEVALSVDRIGFTSVDVDPTDLITDRSWREMVLS